MFNYYIDGSFSSATNIGAYGFILETETAKKAVIHQAKNTTNNRMELCALIAVLNHAMTVKDKGIPTIFCDSKYVIEGLQNWLPNWKKNKWKTAAGKAVKNIDLWLKLDLLSQGIQFNLQWVKGHSSTHLHNVVDDLLAKVTKKGHS